ncbi:MAG: hypothetical protein IJ959_00385, partial [Clostridia bacterium]|nr:hypothetical protein [Clostridia bacterium]
DNHAGLSASAGALTPQEKLLAGTLELDPENDPVIYTTDYGLDIRWHMAGLPNNPNDIAIMPGGQKFETYAYFTHADVNWVIIGCSNKSTTLSGVLNLSNILEYYYHKAGYYNFSNTTSDIWHYLANPIDHELEDQLKDVYSLYDGKVYASHSNSISQTAVFPNAQSTSELEHNEVLCFAQTYLPDRSVFRTSGNCYYGSTLQSSLETYYNANLMDLDSRIMPKTLRTIWYGVVDKTNGDDLPGTYKIFPLAGGNANESFYLLNYLDASSSNLNAGKYWWLRSGHTGSSQRDFVAYISHTNTGIYYYPGSMSDPYPRPAFVLKI